MRADHTVATAQLCKERHGTAACENSQDCGYCRIRGLDVPVSEWCRGTESERLCPTTRLHHAWALRSHVGKTAMSKLVDRGRVLLEPDDHTHRKANVEARKPGRRYEPVSQNSTPQDLSSRERMSQGRVAAE